jgi:hypothetical protein
MTIAFLAEKHVRVRHPAARVPNTNIIENVWPILDQELAKKVKPAWKTIPHNFIRNCVLSMPHRLELIRKAKGGHIKY